MDKEFLVGLGLEETVAEAIWEQHQQAIDQQEEKLQSLQFSHAVESAVEKAGGRNLKAVTALLDMEALRKEEDVPAALEKALKTLKKENGWLFETVTPPAFAPYTGADMGAKEKPMSLAAALRERMKK